MKENNVIIRMALPHQMNISTIQLSKPEGSTKELAMLFERYSEEEDRDRILRDQCQKFGDLELSAYIQWLAFTIARCAQNDEKPHLLHVLRIATAVFSDRINSEVDG